MAITNLNMLLTGPGATVKYVITLGMDLAAAGVTIGSAAKIHSARSVVRNRQDRRVGRRAR